MRVEVRDAAGLESFEGADAVVLGSAISGGRWLEPARRLIEERSGELASRPTWLFSVGPVGEPLTPEEAGLAGIREAMDATRARAHEVLRGQARSLRAQSRRAADGQSTAGPEGDFRDWDAIRTWAHGVAAALP